MKFIRLFTVAALSTTILAGGSINVLAEETSELRGTNSDGQIEFVPDNGPLEVIPPEEGPDVELHPDVEGTTGPLSIVKVSQMDFGTQVISTSDENYNMVAEMQQLIGTEGEEGLVPYVSFAQVQDLRGNNEGWQLRLSLDEFTSDTRNGVLTAAELHLDDPRIQYSGRDENQAPSAHGTRLTLIPGGSGQPIMTANTGQGAGASSVVWGNQADLNAQFADLDNLENQVVENKNIILSVPGSTAKDAAIYTSTLTWELTAAPGADV